MTDNHLQLVEQPTYVIAGNKAQFAAHREELEDRYGTNLHYIAHREHLYTIQDATVVCVGDYYKRGWPIRQLATRRNCKVDRL